MTTMFELPPLASTSRVTLDTAHPSFGRDSAATTTTEQSRFEEVNASVSPPDDSEDDLEVDADTVPASNSALPLPGGLAAVNVTGFGGPMPGLQQVAQKSCVRCRVRKVKCDRIWPGCGRCRKRKEQCEYGDVSLAIQLRSTDTTAKSRVVRGIHDAASPTPYVKPTTLPAKNETRQQTAQLVTRHTPSDNDLKNLWQSFMRSNIGEHSVDWKLAKPAMASSLTLHLLEASRHSCCFHLPAFHVFADRVGQLKSRLDSLDIQGEVIVTVLASLGARASPHSALIGVDGPDLDIQKTTPISHEFVLDAGSRREQAWKAIADRAVALCSTREILQVPSKQNVEILVALIQMLMLSKVRPIKSRFFLRNVVGMFADLQSEDSEMPMSEVLAIKRTVGRSLYECDARVAAYSSSPLFISDDDIEESFGGTGVVVPNLECDDLGPILDTLLDERAGPIDRARLDDAIALSGGYVCALQRACAKITSARRLNSSYLYEVPRLWAWIDRAHGAVQGLHRRLYSLQQSGVRNIGGDHDIEYDLLIAVRLDARLIDLLNLSHEFLRRQLSSPPNLTPYELQQLDSLFMLSDKRVRKGLKLTAFYFKVFVDSLDKHMVYHLVVQLQALPSWAVIAPQRVGEATAAGPLDPECELSERELDWLQSALELACFFTPLAHDRLQDLKAGRDARRVVMTPADILHHSYASDPQPALPSHASQRQQPPFDRPYAPLSAQTSSIYVLPAAPVPTPPNARQPLDETVAQGPSLSPFTFDSYGTPSYRQSPNAGYLNGGPSGDNNISSGMSEGSSWLPQGFSFSSSIYNPAGQAGTPPGQSFTSGSQTLSNAPMMYSSEFGSTPTWHDRGLQQQTQRSPNLKTFSSGLSSDGEQSAWISSTNHNGPGGYR